MNVTLHLPAQTVAWLADHPQARKLVGSVGDTLAELERAGHHPPSSRAGSALVVGGIRG